ncbi:MAG: PASTA domain-containing protein [Fluviicola sp.]
MITFDYFTMRIAAADAAGEPLTDYPVLIKYYDFEEEGWLTLYEETIVDGSLVINRSVDDATTEEIPFFDYIHNGYIPQLVVVSEVSEAFNMNLLASAPEVYSPKEGTVSFDFGGIHMVPAEILPGTNRYYKFRRIASPFPVALPSIESGPLPIQDLYSNLVSEIVQANDNNVDSTFKLSNISVKLKALIHEEDGAMSASLLDLENSETVNGDAISELVFDITPVQQTQAVSNEMIDLTGFTESAVRKILQMGGLKLNPVYQKNLDVVNGDSFKQSPAAGEIVQPNQLVTVIFSKHE